LAQRQNEAERPADPKHRSSERNPVIGPRRPQFATAELTVQMQQTPSSLALKYFPNLYEHREIINLVDSGYLTSLYFFEPSHTHGPFLSQSDHSRLQEYHSYNVDVHWVSKLTSKLMTHTMRDGLGYFVLPERLVDFHRSMIFAFYGSSLDLTPEAVDRLGNLLDALIRFWGKNIGILTGGGSGVMGMANKFAKERGILSGANFLDITDQEMNKYVDFCQVFQSTCRHSRQKWFEITSFPIFNIGGIGTLEELGITLCNMKLSIADPVPIIMFDTEGDGRFWVNLVKQVHIMVQEGRAPGWIKDRLVMTNDPAEVIDAYRRYLHLF
jgi:predicted Rossmann-fold nucleotide-binding protein